MKVLESFNPLRLDKIFRNHLSISSESELEYSEKECDCNQSVSILKVNGGGVKQEYILVKVFDTQINEAQFSSSLLPPEFIIENNNHETYGAFRRQSLEQFSTVHRNDVEQLKIVLKTLAEIQTNSLIINEESSNEYNLKAIIEEVLTSKYFANINHNKIVEVTEALGRKFNSLLKLELVTKSVWAILGSNVYTRGDECIFLQLSSQKQKLPPAYDALLYIFSLSDEKFRQRHFEDLISYYFQTLQESVKKGCSELCDNVNRLNAELQVNSLLPIIKIKFADDLIKASSSSDEIKNVVSNISYYLKYPNINKEDVNEATRNYFLSTDYQLLNYQLIPLDVKNGHLGEYFHLKITAKFHNKEQQLKLFTKILMSDNEILQEVIEHGVGKKEDFFYKILYPLFKDHGLDDLLDFAPKCYLSRLSGLLILQDLNDMGYSGLKPNNVLNFDGQKLILGKLAKFHAATLIVEQKLSRERGKKVRLYDDFAEYLQETILKYDGHLQKWYDYSIKSVHYIIRKCPNLTKAIEQYSEEEVYEKLRILMLSPFSKVKRSEHMRNVINHGDMYIANMLFKFGAGESIDDGILIDFQLLRYVPPAYEVLFFIFLNTTKSTRKMYLNTLLNWYFENVSSHLKKFNLDPEEIFPRKEFDEDVQHSKCPALATAFNYAHLTHADPEFREEILHDQEKSKYYLEENKDEFIDICWEVKHYRDIVTGLVEDLVDTLNHENYVDH